MARSWTEKQLLAMNTHGRALLISAAAGSGKTATLTERIIRDITRKDDPADIKRILAVTFTKAAAAELRARISKSLSDKISEDPDNSRLYEQLMSLGSASISTIDAFYLEPVRANFDRLGLPPSFRLADEEELSPIRSRIMNELISDFFRNHAGEEYKGGSCDLYSIVKDNPFSHLIDGITPSREDSDLDLKLFQIYDRFTDFPEGLDALLSEAERLETEADGDFLDSAHGKIFRDMLMGIFNYAKNILLPCIPTVSATPFVSQKYLPAFEDDLKLIDTCIMYLNASDYAELRFCLSTAKFTQFGRKKNSEEETTAVLEAAEKRTAAKELLNSVKKEYVFSAPEEIKDCMVKHSHHCRILYEFLSEYDRRINEEKKMLGICDFKDVRRFMLELLLDEDGSPSDIAKEMNKRYDSVYIDEYQDVDSIQDKIFELIGGDKRFMVGDIKQSIYEFRGAEPSVFAGYRKHFPTIGSDADDGKCGVSLYMSENFRCDKNVIDFTNAVCSKVFSASPDKIGYTKDDDLIFSKLTPTPEYTSPKVEVRYLDSPLKSNGEKLTEDEYTAITVTDLLKSGKTLASGKPIAPEDIAILLRTRTHMPKIKEELTKRGVPVLCESGGRSKESFANLSMIMNLLRAVDNPRYDVPLNELMQSSFGGFTLDELIEVRKTTDPSLTLYEAVSSYSESNDSPLSVRLHDFVSTIDKYTKLSCFMPADKLISVLMSDTRLASYSRDSALTLIYDKARAYRTSSWRSLSSFVKYAERMIENDDLGTNTEAGGKGVSIITLHGSKGLEYPVVFICNASRSFGADRKTKDMYFEKDTGLSMTLFDSDNSSKIKNIFTFLAKKRITENEIDEEMRLLYVAMTRARERLFVIGAPRNGRKHDLDLASLVTNGDKTSIHACGTYMNWILSAHMSDSIPKSCYNFEFVENTGKTAENAKYRSLNRQAEDKGKTDGKTIIIPPHTYVPDDKYDLSSIPAKVAASKLKDDLIDSCIISASPDGGDVESRKAIEKRIELLRSTPPTFESLMESRPTSAERGTALHEFFRFCDFSKISADSGKSEAKRLLSEGFITERQESIIEFSHVKRFAESPIFQSILTSKLIKKEFRFNLFKPLENYTSNDEIKSAVKDELLHIQGSIDLLFEDGDGSLIICDYKTDTPTLEEKANISLFRERLTHEYTDQISVYREAVTQIFGERNIKTLLFSLWLGEEIAIH